MRNSLPILLMPLVIAAAGPVIAQDNLYAPSFISEVRGGILAHNVDEPGPTATLGVMNLTRIQDANVELLFSPPDVGFWQFIGNPRPMVGATISFGGLESMVYGGLTWRVPVFDTPVFIEGALGGTLHNGVAAGAVYPARSQGCNAAFYEAASIGYQFNENVSAMVTFQHSSHAWLCGPNNQGITNLGVRLGWTF